MKQELHIMLIFDQETDSQIAVALMADPPIPSQAEQDAARLKALHEKKGLDAWWLQSIAADIARVACEVISLRTDSRPDIRAKESFS